MDLGCGIQRFRKAYYKIKFLFMPPYRRSGVPNIEMDLRVTASGGMDWIDVSPDREDHAGLS
jgi:hypothetical protein